MIRFEEWSTGYRDDLSRNFVITMGRGLRVACVRVSEFEAMIATHPAKAAYRGAYLCARQLDECVMGPQLELPGVP